VKKIILFLTLFFMILSPINADIKENIITNLKNIQNLSFNFEQTINQKIEKGICILEYPKKIYCEYDNINKKLMISNGDSLVIINQKSNQYYRYPLKKTGLNYILDKNYLINQIKSLKGRIIDGKYYNFTLMNNEVKINIFFDNKSLNLIGWQTEDIYQNLVITFISSIKINQKIDKDKFKFPEIR
tara:strand:- start:24 stop:581 length:558 start_codon:yes stop_codon:yes gene_type:complete